MGLKPEAECYSCFRRGFSDYIARAGIPPGNLELFIKPVDEALDRGLPPPVAGVQSWKLLRRESSNGSDIFREEKRDITRRILQIYHDLKDRFAAMDNPALEALAATAWSNLLDVGQGNPLPLIPELLELFHRPLAADGREEFLTSLSRAGSFLILGDNAGETVLDRLFLELSGFTGRVFYMTREEPVMNDALTEDAEMAGLHLEATVLSSGIDMPSVIPELLSGEALRVFREADLILAKGQGNLEGLFGSGDDRIYHSFTVKCPVVSRAVKIPEGEGVFRRFEKGWS